MHPNSLHKKPNSLNNSIFITISYENWVQWYPAIAKSGRHVPTLTSHCKVCPRLVAATYFRQYFSQQIRVRKNSAACTVRQYFIWAGQNNNSQWTRSHGTFSPQCYDLTTVTGPFLPPPKLGKVELLRPTPVCSRARVTVVSCTPSPASV